MIAAALSLQDPRSARRGPPEGAGAGRPAARPLQGRRGDFLTPAQPLALPARAAGASSRLGVPPDVQARSSSTTCGCGSGRDFESQLRQVCKEMGISVGRPTDTPGRRRHPPGAAVRAAQPHRHARGAGSTTDRRGTAQVPRRRGARFAIFPRQRAAPEEPAVRHGRRARGDQPPVGAAERRHQARVGRAAGPRPGETDLQRAALEQEAGIGDGPRAGHAVRRPRWSPTVSSPTARWMPRSPASCSSGTRSCRRVGGVRAGAAPVPRRPTGGCSGGRGARAPGPPARHRRRRGRCSTSDQRVPADVVSGAHFDSWWKQERQRNGRLLTFDPAMLTRDTADEVSEADYPWQWAVSGPDEGGLTFPISYHFEPGRADDGLTIDVPSPRSTGSRPTTSPGTSRACARLVTSLIRSLPKNLRRASCRRPTGRASSSRPSRRARSRCSTRSSGGAARRPASSSPGGAGTGRRSPSTCDRRTASSTRTVASRRAAGPRRRSRSRCGRGSPRPCARSPPRAGWLAPARRRGSSARSTASFRQHRAGHEVRQLPGPGGRGRHRRVAGLRVRRRGRARHRLGVRRLLLLELDSPVKRVLDGLTNVEKLGLAGSPYPSVGELLEDCRAAVVGAAVDARPPVRDEASYHALRTGPAATSRPTCARSWPTWCGCWTRGGGPERASAGAPGG